MYMEMIGTYLSTIVIALLEREASAQIGEGLTCARVMRGGHFWQLGSVASLATETTGGVILVAFSYWPKHGLRSNLRVPN